MKLCFGKSSIQLDSHFCSLNGKPPSKINNPYVNLYVRVTNNCNANCAFCEFSGKDNNKFDFNKFKYIIGHILKQKVVLNKVSFTGGEPTTQPHLLRRCVELVKALSPETFVVVNTNGYNLAAISSFSSGIDSVSLSRHHYDEETHKKIMCSNHVATNNTLKFLPKSVLNKIHLTCTVINGYIDTTEAVKAYLDWAAKFGVYDIGFVGLMPINDYCRTHYVDFLQIALPENTVNNKIWSKGSCRCANYLYLPREGTKVVKFYYRYNDTSLKQKQKQQQLVFNIDELQNGFNGEVIDIAY